MEIKLEKIWLHIAHEKPGVRMNKFRVELKTPYSEELCKSLIPFKFRKVKASFLKNDKVVCESTFDLITDDKDARSGPVLFIIMEKSYEKEFDLKIAPLKFNDIDVLIERIQDELVFEDDEFEETTVI